MGSCMDVASLKVCFFHTFTSKATTFHNLPSPESHPISYRLEFTIYFVPLLFLIQVCSVYVKVVFDRIVNASCENRQDLKSQ